MIEFDPATPEYAEFALKMPPKWDEGAITFTPFASKPKAWSVALRAWEIWLLARGFPAGLIRPWRRVY